MRQRVHSNIGKISVTSHRIAYSICTLIADGKVLKTKKNSRNMHALFCCFSLRKCIILFVNGFFLRTGGDTTKNIPGLSVNLMVWHFDILVFYYQYIASIAVLRLYARQFTEVISKSSTPSYANVVCENIIKSNQIKHKTNNHFFSLSISLSFAFSLFARLCKQSYK